MKLHPRINMTDPPGPARVTRQRRKRRVRLLASMPVAAALLSAALIAGCGGSSDDGSVAHIDTSTTAKKSSASDSSSSLEVQLLKFAECVRSHGDADFPDPVIGSNGQPHMGGGGAPLRNPQFGAAKEACYKYTPAGSATPAETAAALAKAVKFAKCMQSHGEPDFPDPTSSGEFNLSPQADIDSSSPRFQAAQKACQSLDPGLQLQAGGGAG